MNQTENGEPNYGENALSQPSPYRVYGSDEYFNSSEGRYQRQRDERDSRTNRRHTALSLAIGSYTGESATSSDIVKRAIQFDTFLESGQ